MIHGINMYVSEQYNLHKIEILQWPSEHKTISPHGAFLFVSQKDLATTKIAYKINRIGVTLFSVVETASVKYTQHTINIDIDNTRCVPCSFWSQNCIPCRHMIMGIFMHAPNLLCEDR